MKIFLKFIVCTICAAFLGSVCMASNSTDDKNSEWSFSVYNGSKSYKKKSKKKFLAEIKKNIKTVKKFTDGDELADYNTKIQKKIDKTPLKKKLLPALNKMENLIAAWETAKQYHGYATNHEIQNCYTYLCHAVTDIFHSQRAKEEDPQYENMEQPLKTLLEFIKRFQKAVQNNEYMWIGAPEEEAPPESSDKNENSEETSDFSKKDGDSEEESSPEAADEEEKSKEALLSKSSEKDEDDEETDFEKSILAKPAVLT